MGTDRVGGRRVRYTWSLATTGILVATKMFTLDRVNVEAGLGVGYAHMY